MLYFPPPFKPLNCTSKPITSKNNKKGFVAASVSQQNCSPFLWVTVLLRQSHSRATSSGEPWGSSGATAVLLRRDHQCTRDPPRTAGSARISHERSGTDAGAPQRLRVPAKGWHWPGAGGRHVPGAPPLGKPPGMMELSLGRDAGRNTWMVCIHLVTRFADKQELSSGLCMRTVTDNCPSSTSSSIPPAQQG